MDIKEKIAKVCHEVNRAYCESLGDYSQTSWEKSPEWQKKSAIAGVQFHFDNPGCHPASSHESWWEEKRKNGWVYGPNKDAEMKTHPCCVPFNQLPVHQRAKDYIFQAIVEAMAGDE